MKNFKRVPVAGGTENLLSITPQYTIIGTFNGVNKETLMESPCFADADDYLDSIFTNAMQFGETEKGNKWEDMTDVTLNLTLFGVAQDTDILSVIYSAVVKHLKAVTETNTTRVKIRDKMNKKAKPIELTIAEVLKDYINKDVKEDWMKYDISDWRAGLAENTNYIEV